MSKKPQKRSSRTSKRPFRKIWKWVAVVISNLALVSFATVGHWMNHNPSTNHPVQEEKSDGAPHPIVLILIVVERAGESDDKYRSSEAGGIGTIVEKQLPMAVNSADAFNNIPVAVATLHAVSLENLLIVPPYLSHPNESHNHSSPACVGSAPKPSATVITGGIQTQGIPTPALQEYDSPGDPGKICQN